MLDGPVPYHLRVSPRARNVSLRVTAEHGLEVVVPQGYNPVLVPKFVEHMREWIQGALARVQARQRQVDLEPLWQLPPEIALPGIGKQWRIVARESVRASVSVREYRAGQLVITGALNDERACCAALGRWLSRQASRELVSQLESVSDELGLRYRKVQIRMQRARWGSCSSRQTISLNAKLLLLPPPLVRSVMIHELCHLREMNHSPRFWSLVERYDPDFRTYRKTLREAWKLVPPWVKLITA